MAKQTIIIVGAGLSGLTLGRCLLKRGIPAVLYERADSPARYSYGITLHASTYAPLLKVLDVDEKDFKSRVAVDASIGGTGKISNATATSESCFRANRGKLEEWLREGFDLKWNLGLHLGPQSVERPSRTSKQWTTICLDNGQKVQSDIVIGADGPHSALRKAVLPERELTVLPYVVYNGKRRIDHAVFEEKIRPHLTDSNIVNFKYGDARVNISINEYQPAKVSMSWTYSRPSRGASDPLHKPERALSGATTVPEELYHEIDSLQGVLPEPFVSTLDTEMLRKDRILHWLMRTTLVPKEDLQSLAQDGIVLMGDAAHAQPIVGGNGANEAISDAVSLAEHIAYGQKDLTHWLDGRYSVWEGGVDAAQNNIAALHSSISERL
ncbi:FAD/NAD(P)-binding domain-containing protein [Ophiobolus disseminans]|uniref:FAD/NAD(P)-binding domain-containing protein n=1 Tax=Ophiobolus disseminans TaxID=1469910 RepID=A0A6A6ZNR3_9PLEO|nr:FAD/NAD(P)-binding domain-containing protein [Ophiobolus disseminans]